MVFLGYGGRSRNWSGAWQSGHLGHSTSGSTRRSTSDDSAAQAHTAPVVCLGECQHVVCRTISLFMANALVTVFLSFAPLWMSPSSPLRSGMADIIGAGGAVACRAVSVLLAECRRDCGTSVTNVVVLEGRRL